VLNTYEQQRQSQMILTETQEETNSYDTTDQLKRLTILKKVKIKETNTHETQVKEDYSNST
jgi:hypothetical protein